MCSLSKSHLKCINKKLLHGVNFLNKRKARVIRGKNHKFFLLFPRLKGGSYEKNVKCVCVFVPGQKNTDQSRKGLMKETKKTVALYGSKVFGNDE